MRFVLDETVSPSELICLESETESRQQCDSAHFLPLREGREVRCVARIHAAAKVVDLFPWQLLAHLLTVATSAHYAGTGRQTIQQCCAKGIALHRHTPAKAKDRTHGRRWESNELLRS